VEVERVKYPEASLFLALSAQEIVIVEEARPFLLDNLDVYP
jgi:hypothetical protein